MNWRLHHRAETVSTNLDARQGLPGDVFTADFQTAGRGRLDHKWLSPPGENLMMSVVLPVEGLAPDHVSTLPLVVGLSVAETLGGRIKWPNDVLVDGRKLAGILCERHGDRVVAGIGVNVGQRTFSPEIAARATSLAVLGREMPVSVVRDRILAALGRNFPFWRDHGFGAVHPLVAALDELKGRPVSVRQADDDATPVSGICGGIRPDGTLDVAGVPVYAGEAHVAF